MKEKDEIKYIYNQLVHFYHTDKIKSIIQKINYAKEKKDLTTLQEYARRAGVEGYKQTNEERILIRENELLKEKLEQYKKKTENETMLRNKIAELEKELKSKAKKTKPKKSKINVKMKRFLNNKDGTVTDIKTGLMWSKEGVETWISEIDDTLSTLHLGGFNDWRIPTIKELSTLYNEKYKNKDSYGSRCYINSNFKIFWREAVSSEFTLEKYGIVFPSEKKVNKTLDFRNGRCDNADGETMLLAVRDINTRK